MEAAAPPNPKRKLPFKRTVKRRSSENTDEKDGLSLFSRSNDYFPSVIEAQKKQAAEKAAKQERERKGKLAREREEEEEAISAQLSRETESASAKKRRRINVLDDDDDFRDQPIKARKSSTPTEPTHTIRENTFIRTRSTRNSSRASASQARGAPVVNIDDSDDDVQEMDSPTVAVKGRHGSPSRLESTVIDDDTDTKDSDVPIFIKDTGDGGVDPYQHYVTEAMERLKKTKAERLNKEAVDSSPSVKILIVSDMEGFKPVVFTRRTMQTLDLVFNSWVSNQLKHTKIDEKTLRSVRFTWKGNIVYPTSTLATLGINPSNDGSLVPSWKSGSQEGYRERNKVLFEAWTPEMYEEFQKRREKERMRERGEYDPDDEEDGAGGGNKTAEQPSDKTEEQQQQEDKIRVFFVAKDEPRHKASVRKSTTVAQLFKVYRKLAKLDPDRTIEIRFDGDVLDADATVEDADIDDLCALEVYVR
ncbi:hypothetical protein F4778DRAFT_411491 [Xylariomycetidae sp. FL2044]|nr:hypothetical protein F4778DRAFT_411491 [Xylariomycetidae sp. FL2044]